MLMISESKNPIQKSEFTQLGSHTLVEFSSCNPQRISFAGALEPIVLKAVALSGATYVSHHFKQFRPVGASGVVLIAESHVSFHTWPEHGYVAFDIFTCSETMKVESSIAYLVEQLEAKEVKKQILKRGY